VQQQKTALASVIPFFRTNVGNITDVNFNQTFDPQYDLPSAVTSVTRVDRGFTPSPNFAITTVFEDFDKPTGTNTSGATNNSNNITINHVTAIDCDGLPAGCLTVPDHFYTHDIPVNDVVAPPSPSDLLLGPQLFRAGAISWTSSGANTYFQTNWLDSGGLSVSGYQALEFRIDRQRSDTNPTQPHSLNSLNPTNFSVQLVFADGSLSKSVCLSTYTDLRGPVGGVAGLHPVMRTVRISLADFNCPISSADLPCAGLQFVRGIRLIFDKTATGAIYLANVRFTRR
jgi:hypothetical protein